MGPVHAFTVFAGRVELLGGWGSCHCRSASINPRRCSSPSFPPASHPSQLISRPSSQDLSHNPDPPGRQKREELAGGRAVCGNHRKSRCCNIHRSMLGGLDGLASTDVVINETQ